jgi:beta-glucanase (GH16 family)
MSAKISSALRSTATWLGGLGLIVTSVVTIIALGAGLVSAAPAFTEQWTGATSPYFNFLLNGGSTITSNVADAAASDGKIVDLTLPAFPNAGPSGGPNLQSPILYGFGTYEARIKTVDCSMQPNSGVITGFFTYLNDGTDQDGDGVKDNSEIDFEWLCAEPNVVWLTMWTDFQESPLAMRRVYRELDIATGTIRRTCYSEGYGACTQDLTGSSTEGQPATIAGLSGYNSSAAYYTYGFTWATNRMTWYMYHPSTGAKIILWDYQGPTTRITQRSAYYMFNAWHTNNWSPTNMPGAFEQPNSDRQVNIVCVT